MLGSVDPLVVCGPEAGINCELVVGICGWVMGPVGAPLQVVSHLGVVVE